MQDSADLPSPPDFRALFETLPGLYLVLDTDFTVVAVSDAYARAAGRRREDMLGRIVVALAGDDDPAADELRDSLQRVRERREADAMPVRRLGHNEAWWRPVNSPVLDQAGRLAYIIHRLDDASDLVRLQQREAEASTRVEAAEAARQRALDEAQRFAYLAAHDLQSPLNAIAGCVRLLAEECEGRLSEAGQRYMGYVLDYTARAQTLIRDLLAYSRLETDLAAGQPTCLAAACAEALDLVGARIAETGAEVVSGQLPTLRADRAQMVQLLAQLLDNAIKFNRAERPEVRVAAERRGEEWLFSVNDNGIGIEARFHGEVFEIFRRLHSAQDYPGSGIGLAICQRIVSRHGGRIWVESQAGAGCTFYFTLPADKDSA